MKARGACLVAWLALGATLTGCDKPEEAGLYSERLYAMATWVDLSVVARDRTSAEAGFGDVETMLARAERDFYAWNPQGELAHLNAALARGERVELSPDLAELLQRARAVYQRSHGYFDPGVGALVALWGFNSMSTPPHEAPSSEAIDAVLAHGASIARLTLDGRTAWSDSKALVLDLGGIAKGFVVDRALELLAARGIHDALVNAGGDLRVAGRHAGRAWRVGIKDPRHDGVLATIDLADGEAAFTSGDYERYFVENGHRFHHLLDPRTGRPAEHTESVTVIAADGVTADAAATALFVAGPEHWRETAAALGVSLVLRVDANGALEMTPAMARRLHSAEQGSSDIIAPAQEE